MFIVCTGQLPPRPDDWTNTPFGPEHRIRRVRPGSRPYRTVVDPRWTVSALLFLDGPDAPEGSIVRQLGERLAADSDGSFRDEPVDPEPSDLIEAAESPSIAAAAEAEASVRRQLDELAAALDERGYINDPELHDMLLQERLDRGASPETKLYFAGIPARDDHLAQLERYVREKHAALLPRDYAGFLRRFDGLQLFEHDPGCAGDPHVATAEYEDGSEGILPIRGVLQRSASGWQADRAVDNEAYAHLLVFYEWGQGYFEAIDFGPPVPRIVSVYPDESEPSPTASCFADWLHAWLAGGLVVPTTVPSMAAPSPWSDEAIAGWWRRQLVRRERAERDGRAIEEQWQRELRKDAAGVAAANDWSDLLD